ncbi:hypothetical protein [Candidatus Nitrosopumilus sediminis]|uniref:Uncharacterized protein n=1 Tax=Candidatus Nitrosopumilus sediminis TaxID=1229909 RepID=K0BCS7_9ARCH|nr:hypothetical protein [Candidatus Nitrosopumilus sediminis]AFS83269.1 hypothetical protein NSED_07375 [Candidatus Nitrosopumilus sediminis]
MPHEENLKPNNIPSKQTIVLRTKLLPQDIMKILEKKKTSLFGSTLRRPKSDEVTVDNPQLFLEQFIFVLGHYEIDFNRNTTYMIKVEPDVVEVAIGTEKFSVLNKSGVWKKFGKKMKQGVGITKQDLEIKATENVIKSMTDSIYLDNNGLETPFSYSTNSDAIENYAQKVLDLNKGHVRRNKMIDDDIFSKLAHKLKDSLKHDLKINHEEFIVTEFREIFVPIYETKCYDNKNKVAVARIDAITGKLI